MTTPTPDELKEIQDLVNSGDIELSEYRGQFKAILGRDTTLTDEQIVAFIAEHEHDDPLEPSDRAYIMEKMEQETPSAA